MYIAHMKKLSAAKGCTTWHQHALVTHQSKCYKYPPGISDHDAVATYQALLVASKQASYIIC